MASRLFEARRAAGPGGTAANRVGASGAESDGAVALAETRACCAQLANATLSLLGRNATVLLITAGFTHQTYLQYFPRSISPSVHLVWPTGLLDSGS
jgi:hypothetical protein